MALKLEGDPAIAYLDAVVATYQQGRDLEQGEDIRPIATLTQILKAYLFLESATTDRPASFPLAIYGLPSLGYWLASVDTALQEFKHIQAARGQAINSLVVDLVHHQLDSIQDQADTRAKTIAGDPYFTQTLTAIDTRNRHEAKQYVTNTLHLLTVPEEHAPRFIEDGYLLVEQTWRGDKKRDRKWKPDHGFKFVLNTAKPPRHSFFLVQGYSKSSPSSLKMIPNLSAEVEEEEVDELSSEQRQLYDHDLTLSRTTTYNYGTGPNAFHNLLIGFDFASHPEHTTEVLNSLTLANLIVTEIRMSIDLLQKAPNKFSPQELAQKQVSWAQDLYRLYHQCPEVFKDSLQAAVKQELEKLQPQPPTPQPSSKGLRLFHKD